MPHMALYKLKLLDEFEDRTGLWTFGDFENRLMELWRGATRHDAKGIINAAHNERRWPRTVKRYCLPITGRLAMSVRSCSARLPRCWSR